MSYVVLARKWRPMRFEDLVGQDHVARTLGNAIDAGRVAHAFLFTGVRGVGKTTSARILAKALNCMRAPGTLEPGAPDPGPTVTPCLKCPACLEIAEGRDTDVQEIDGASYNGVDEVRKLQDSLPYRPSRDRHKVVIVDEVHMLTPAAWNAFLKTLEEPPPHVKFIFATTEVHKVPITILSRVQRFDFKMIPTRLIVDRLRWVLEQEESSADDVALGILARQAAGSMRDAMSLLDQVIAFSGETLSGDEVARVLGVASRGALLDIGRAVVTGDSEKCLSVVGSLADQGFDIPHVTRDVLGLLRDLVVAKVVKEPGHLLDLADEERAEVMDIARSASENDLLRLHQAFSKGYDDVVRSSDPRAGLEMLLVRLALRPPLLPVDELLHRIGNLEKRLMAGGASASRGRSSGGGGGGGGGSSRDPAPAPAQRPRQRSAQDKSASTPQPATNDDDVPDAPPAAPLARAEQHQSHPAFVAPERPAPTREQSLGHAQAGHPQAGYAQAAQPQLAQARVAKPQTAPGGQPIEADVDPSYKPSSEERDRLALMMKILDRVRETDAQLAAYMEQTVPLFLDKSSLEVGLEKAHLFEKQITSDEAQTLLKKALLDECGPEVELKLSLNHPDATPNRTVSAERARARHAQKLAAIEEVKNHPRVREVIEIFNAQIKHVNIAEMN